MTFTEDLKVHQEQAYIWHKIFLFKHEKMMCITLEWLIQLEDGLSFPLHGDEIDIYKFVKHAQVHVQKYGFEDVFHVINDSIVGFNHNEAKLFLQISLKCI